jgi:hypothetical protein
LQGGSAAVFQQFAQFPVPVSGKDDVITLYGREKTAQGYVYTSVEPTAGSIAVESRLT